MPAICRNLPGVRGATTVRTLAANVGVLVLVAKLKAKIIDDISDALDDISALGQVALGGQTADILEADDSIGVGGGGETRQDTLLGQEQGAGADGEESASDHKHVSKKPLNWRDGSLM